MPEERNERRRQHRKQAVEWTLAEIPAQLIRNMAQLRLEPTEFIFLAYLLAADVGWKEGKPVALPLRDVEQATGLSIGTIHKEKKGPHLLRHSGASHLSERGEDPRII